MTTTKSKAPVEDAPLEIDATFVREETYAPVWGPLLKPIEGLAAFLPAHRDSKQGRQTAKQIRIVILAVGLVLLLFGGWPLLLLGGAIMASALVLPISEVTKRAWRTRLRRMRKQRRRKKTEQGKVVHDGKRLILRRGDEKLRRVLVDRGEHRLEERRRGDTPCLGVLPPSKRKAESIWLCAPNHGSATEEAAPLNDSDVDILVELTPNDWERMNRLLNE